MMDITQLLQQVSSKTKIQEIADTIGTNPAQLAQLVNIVLESDNKSGDRAAWVLSFIDDKNPALLVPHLPALIYNLEATTRPAIIRLTLRTLQNKFIPLELQGILANNCFSYLSGNAPVAIKAFALTILFNLSQAEPDLKNEIRLCLEAQLPLAKPALRVRAEKIWPALSR